MHGASSYITCMAEQPLLEARHKAVAVCGSCEQEALAFAGIAAMRHGRVAVAPAACEMSTALHGAGSCTALQADCRPTVLRCSTAVTASRSICVTTFCDSCCEVMLLVHRCKG
jgi:hypothetical protein